MSFWSNSYRQVCVFWCQIWALRHSNVCIAPSSPHLENPWLPSTAVKPSFYALDKKWNLKLTHCWRNHFEKIESYLLSNIVPVYRQVCYYLIGWLTLSIMNSCCCSSSSCGLLPRFCLRFWQKKRLFYAVFTHFRPYIVFSSNLSNF